MSRKWKLLNLLLANIAFNLINLIADRTDIK